ncbi:uncharacterized protein E0L32_006972 [Thyridium curvatum]|uniref:Zn(2)-C6 fungal-type domain-containing protein n=1 Tax=Thyridium curvatum TaxID=1093900 RepID=A0A507ANG2_9PEZI|nr:uncharacterized protein E0L32_006972 [Thyridium curvatum]TPX12325.1 hypothetical protein E0L32_006972 [Thyridium curvatum]
MLEPHDSPDLEHLTPEEASRIIHSHRKVRYGTACWPCRQRKVKCDNKQPCENCIKRDHAQLCSYKPNRSSSGKGGSAHASVVSDSVLTKKRHHSPDEHDDARPGPGPSAEAAAIKPYVDGDSAEVSRYLGQNSIPALLREQTSEPQEGVEYIRQDMRSIFGLDNSAPFPLMSSRHLDRMTSDIAAELPSDREVMKLFRTYKETPHKFWGFVIDIDELESRLMNYLEDRAKNARNSTKVTKPVSASWLAILFAVLAVGSQYHDSPYHIRTRDSQRYIQISFHFLMVGNFLLRPNFDSIQALLLTGFVLLNDMKAEASWALLGLTIRLAQSLGLDRASHLEGHQSPDIAHRELIRRKLWWKCVWHDNLTSLSFDRAPMTNAVTSPPPMLPGSEGNWTYIEAMYKLTDIIARRLNPDAHANTTYEQILANCDEFESIRTSVQPQLRSKEACKTAMDRLQYFAIRLHTSFTISVCCRPALRRGDGGNLDAVQKQQLGEKCKQNLTETVRMFLSMHQLSVIPTRSWAFTYNGLSSAVLLGILGETKTDPEVRQLQGDLIAALSATAAKEQTSPPTHIQKSDRDIELSGPLSRALMALKNIYDHGSITGQNVQNTSSRRNSAALAQLQSSQVSAIGNGSGAGSGAGDAQKGLTSYPRNNTPAGVDPHQDAALAMAEMQNGNNLQDFNATMPYVPSLQQGATTLPDMTNIDPATYMSPMDLYDQIFWESPDPWNTGMDTMNFDFLAQPPPGQPPQQQFYF